MGYGLWNDMIEFNVVELIKDTNFIVRQRKAKYCTI